MAKFYTKYIVRWPSTGRCDRLKIFSFDSTRPLPEDVAKKRIERWNNIVRGDRRYELIEENGLTPDLFENNVERKDKNR